MKKSLIIALALVLVLAFASSAMAAQALNPGTPTPEINGVNYAPTADRFNVDGVTEYPYEIYLPNEQAPDQYRIHSNYAKNTDACASCHSTHTAVGASLLQWYSAYSTCMACHDGTLGSATYNVLDGKIGETDKPTFGGMFGTGNGSESVHNVTGAVDNTAAPGGTTVATEQVNGAHGVKETRWVNEFGCESCHSPHGQGGNARILHPDANYAASWAAEARTDKNKYFVNSTTGAVYSDLGFTQAVYIIKGYPYEPKVINGSVADKTYKIDNRSGASIVKDATGNATTNTNVYVLGVASLQVKMNISGYLTKDESVTHVYGMNFYCGACHTDYNTAAFTTKGSGQEDTGVYAQAHRHQMGMDWFSATPGLKFETTKVEDYAIGSMECLTCHVAHGTSQDYWAATLGGTTGADGSPWAELATDTSYEELAGSSALKRMPNMGTCEACHAKGEGAEGYNVNAGIVPGPSGKANVTSPDALISASPVTLINNWYIGGPVTAAKADTWVGSAACQSCHAEQVAGWKLNRHYSGTQPHGNSCGSLTNLESGNMTCHQLGLNATKIYPNISDSFKYNVTTKVYGDDVAVTCEACHGSGATHIAAPSHENIYNPGRRLQGESAAAQFERESKACGICHNDREVVNASTTVAQINDGSIHDGPTAYGLSKHYKLGIAGCPDCHDAHVSNVTNPAITSLPYEQLCASCHDAGSFGTVDQTMAGGANHTFSFGKFGETIPNDAVASLAAVSTRARSTRFSATPAADGSYYTRSAAAIVKNAAGTITYQTNLAGTWTLTAKPATAVEGVDFTFSSDGVITWYTNSNLVDGLYAAKYVNNASPTVTVTGNLWNVTP